MTELRIVTASQSDLEKMITLDHHVSSDHAYKLELNAGDEIIACRFQRVKLPRAVSLLYPRDQNSLMESWNKAKVIYVGMILDQLVAYVTVENDALPRTARICNLVVAPDVRRKGIGITMLAACEGWATKQKMNRVVIELPMRNDPAIRMAEKAGFELCGFLEQYFPNSDPALFFSKRIG